MPSFVTSAATLRLCRVLRPHRACLGLVLASACAAASAAVPSPQVLETLQEGGTGARVLGVSADGELAAGVVYDAQGKSYLARWSRAAGLRADLAEDGALGVSLEGANRALITTDRRSVVVGTDPRARASIEPSVNAALFYWSSGTGTVAMPTLQGQLDLPDIVGLTDAGRVYVEVFLRPDPNFGGSSRFAEWEPGNAPQTIDLLSANRGNAIHAAVARDGRTLVAAVEEDGVLLLKKLVPGAAVETLSNIRDDVVVAFAGMSSDGRFFAGSTSNSFDGLALFYEGNSKSVIAPLGPTANATVSPDMVISDDGTTVFGNIDQRPFRWTRETGVVFLELATSGFEYVWSGSSADGRVAIANRRDGQSGFVAFRWEDGTGFETLPTGDLPGKSLATGISADGSVIVGYLLNDEDRRKSIPVTWGGLRGESALLRDVGRVGNPSGIVAGATLSLTLDGEVQASTTSDSQGKFNFDDSGLDLSTLYDLRIQRGDVQRVYQAVRPSALVNEPPTLPITLRSRLATQLDRLANTPTLVLGYNVDDARGLMARFNRLQPETAAQHAEHDAALARLLIATEGLADVFSSSLPVARDTATLTVDAISTFLSVRKLLDEIGSEASRRAAGLIGQAQGALIERQVSLALAFIVKALELGVEGAQSAVVDGAKSVLPAWSADLFDKSLGVIIKGVLATFGSGAWDLGEGREGLLQAVVETLAVEVGNRLLASALVAQTQQDLDLAELRAGNLPGGDDVLSAFQATQTRVNENVLRNEDVLALTAFLGATAKGWNTVADLSLLVGRVPAAQLVASLGTVIKGVSVGGLVGASIADYSRLFTTAFSDAPAVGNLAFGLPAGKSLGIVPHGSGPLRAPKQLSPDYSAALDGMRNALGNADLATQLAAGEALLAADRDVSEAIAARRLRLVALAAAGESALSTEALSEAIAAEGRYAADRLILYAMLAGSFEPSFAATETTLQDIHAQFDTVRSSDLAVDASLAMAEAPVLGAQAPPYVLVSAHGLHGTANSGETAPGEFSLRAEVHNAGGATAHDISVTLTPEPDQNSTLSLSLDSPATVTIDSLAAGARVDVIWTGQVNGMETPIGQVVSYHLQPQYNGNAQAAQGGFLVLFGKERIFRSGFDAPAPSTSR